MNLNLNIDFADMLKRKLTKVQRETLQVLLDNGVYAARNAEKREGEYYAWTGDEIRSFGSEIYAITEWI